MTPERREKLKDKLAWLVQCTKDYPHEDHEQTRRTIKAIRRELDTNKRQRRGIMRDYP